MCAGWEGGGPGGGGGTIHLLLKMECIVSTIELIPQFSVSGLGVVVVVVGGRGGGCC